MQFNLPLYPGILEKRYKRFLADIRLDSGEMITAHCANPGSMMGLNIPGSRVWLTKSDNPKRKLAYSWELLEVDLGDGPALVGINTNHPNKIVTEAIEAGAIPELTGYENLRREVKYGVNSRIDILLEDPNRPLCYVEIKNVHLMRQSRLAEFPDSVTKRGTKHLVELGDMVEAGHRAVMLFLIQRTDADRMTLARDIDPNYAETLDRAMSRGVEILAYDTEINFESVRLRNFIPFDPGTT
ncbi:MAG: DNA/RNA nuclease SfsA [Rhizobiales bacterium]|nr:DNA/RNA nuclease SfsA [Hyphomicrobiales bacterium]